MYTKTVTINGQSHTITLEEIRTTGADWRRNAAFRALEVVMRKTLVGSQLFDDEEIRGKIYMYITLVMATVSHDLPFALPDKGCQGEQLLAGLEAFMELTPEETADVLSVVYPLFAPTVDPDTAPPEKLPEGEKKVTPTLDAVSA